MITYLLTKRQFKAVDNKNTSDCFWWQFFSPMKVDTLSKLFDVHTLNWGREKNLGEIMRFNNKKPTQISFPGEFSKSPIQSLAQFIVCYYLLIHR